MTSQAKTVAAYLKTLPADRKAALQAIRKVILDNLDPLYAEGIQYGMPAYFVPHKVYPNGYHCDPKQPLPFASIASQKNHMAIYLFCIYCDPKEVERFQKEWKATGKRLDMGKSCVRFKKIEDVPLEVIAGAIKRATAKKFIAAYEGGLGTKAPAKAKAVKKKVAKKAVKKTAKKTARKVGKKVTKKVAKKATKKVARKTAKKTRRKVAS